MTQFVRETENERGATMTVEVSDPNVLIVTTSHFEAKPTPKELGVIGDLLKDIAYWVGVINEKEYANTH